MYGDGKRQFFHYNTLLSYPKRPGRASRKFNFCKKSEKIRSLAASVRGKCGYKATWRRAGTKQARTKTRHHDEASPHPPRACTTTTTRKIHSCTLDFPGYANARDPYYLTNWRRRWPELFHFIPQVKDFYPVLSQGCRIKWDKTPKNSRFIPRVQDKTG